MSWEEIRKLQKASHEATNTRFEILWSYNKTLTSLVWFAFGFAAFAFLIALVALFK